MSRKMLAVAAFALMAPITMAQAQINFGVAAGATLPNGDLSNSLEMGYHLMATAGVHPPLAPVGFRVDAMYNQFNAKDPATFKYNVMGVTANAVLSMPGAIVLSPYAIGGIGMYNSKSNVTGASSSSDLGVNIGAGVKFGLAGFGAFGEIRLHNLFPEKPTTGSAPSMRFIPVTFGIMF
jgi:hypothetical protein